MLSIAILLPEDGSLVFGLVSLRRKKSSRKLREKSDGFYPCVLDSRPSAIRIGVVVHGWLQGTRGGYLNYDHLFCAAPSDVAEFDFYPPLCYHIPRFERGLEMTGELRDGAIKVSFFGREDWFAYYYAYAKASGKLLHARRHYILKS